MGNPEGEEEMLTESGKKEALVGGERTPIRRWPLFGLERGPEREEENRIKKKGH